MGEDGSLCIELDAADGAVGQRSVPACFCSMVVLRESPQAVSDTYANVLLVFAENACLQLPLTLALLACEPKATSWEAAARHEDIACMEAASSRRVPGFDTTPHGDKHP